MDVNTLTKSAVVTLVSLGWKIAGALAPMPGYAVTGSWPGLPAGTGPGDGLH